MPFCFLYFLVVTHFTFFRPFQIERFYQVTKALEYTVLRVHTFIFCIYKVFFGEDALSLSINRELNIAYSDKKAVDTLVRDLFEKDFKKSKALGLKDVKGWKASPLQIIADQL